MGSRLSFRFTEKLIAKPLDVIHPIRYYDIVFRQDSLDCTIIRSSSGFLSLRLCGLVLWRGECTSIDFTIYPQRIVTDDMDFEFTRRGRDFGFQRFLKLKCSISLPRGRETREYN